jgi:hypothetical protein
MKIKKYIDSKELPQFEDVIQSLCECDYSEQNYDEEGNKTDADIYQDYIESAFEYAKQAIKYKKLRKN